MPLFLYSKIEFITDLSSPEASSIPIGVFAEWFDGSFWKIALCARLKLSYNEFSNLDSFGKTMLTEPFQLLYDSTDHFIKKTGDSQPDHVLWPYLNSTYPAYTSLQSSVHYEYAINEDEDADEMFDDIASNIIKPCKKSFWYRLNGPAQPLKGLRLEDMLD